MPNKLSHDELAKQLNTPGWRLVGDQPEKAVTGTLGEVLTESHFRKRAGDHPGKIEQIETAIELKLFQVEQLWQHLGLPTI
jgi:hypothetical protein